MHELSYFYSFRNASHNLGRMPEIALYLKQSINKRVYLRQFIRQLMSGSL